MAEEFKEEMPNGMTVYWQKFPKGVTPAPNVEDEPVTRISKEDLDRKALTPRKLFEWAKSHGLEDVPLSIQFMDDGGEYNGDSWLYDMLLSPEHIDMGDSNYILIHECSEEDYI